jgi:hypothetical protein
MRDEKIPRLLETHVLDDRAFDTQQPLPYPCKTHAVSRPVDLTLDKPEP